MRNIQLKYIFDPLCGWCYASAPALKALVDACPDKVEILPSGLFSDDGARKMTREWADHAWANDQRIATMTGQIFSEAYHDNVLHAEDGYFDSGMMNKVLTFVREINPLWEPAVLFQLQHARYVDGKDTSQAQVVAAVAAEVLAKKGHVSDVTVLAEHLVNDSELAQVTQARIRSVQTVMNQLDIRGVPQLLLLDDGKLSMAPSEMLYQGGEYLLNVLNRY